MATRLNQAGISHARGFSLNVSNFIDTNTTSAYGQDLAGRVGGKPFVIDTSRNGHGAAPDSQWCNPAGRALGQAPTTNTGNRSIDAYLWVKRPGESDGACNGGPAAGNWWTNYALMLAHNAGW
jgi:endoglucanase